jgi:hypothetical protein
MYTGSVELKSTQTLLMVFSRLRRYNIKDLSPLTPPPTSTFIEGRGH